MCAPILETLRSYRALWSNNDRRSINLLIYGTEENAQRSVTQQNHFRLPNRLLLR